MFIFILSSAGGMRAPECECSAHGAQKRTLDPVALELKADVDS